jgi:putative ABC transport system permease protein
MRPRVPKGGKRVFLERMGGLWKRASFNTRYALKNAMRNKGRFFAVVLGMCGSCALLAFSLGFYDSIDSTQNEYFGGFARYDVIVTFDPLLRFFDHPAEARMDESEKVLVMPVQVRGESHLLAVTDGDFDMVNIPGEALGRGVILPEYFAQQWGVAAGDTLEIDGDSVVVSAVAPQYLGLTMYTSAAYLSGAIKELPPVYNAVYGRSGDMAALTGYLNENRMEYATIGDDMTSFTSIMESMSVLIWFLIACSVILGFTVLYSVGLINLSAREYEYMFMGVMGYPHGRILKAHLKETLVQLALAIPLGFLLGWALLQSIKGEFSGSNFVIAAAIDPQSYLASALMVVGVTVLMAMVTSRHIARLDIVEGLKAQED